MVNINDVKYIKVRVGVRYWEDSSYNGVEDVCLSDATEKIKPNMPFAVATGRKDHYIAPMGEYDWLITIDALSGNIVDWPIGNTANIHYKSCDDNTITLIGGNGEILGEYECYVPDFLCIDEEGYGDYVVMSIDENGHINKFHFGDKDIEQLEKDSFM